MGWLCGPKCECRRRCKSWFSGKPDLKRACKNACSDNTGLSREDFLCSGKYYDQQSYMIEYFTDPCPNDDIRMQDTYDPLDVRGREEQEFEQLQPVLVGLGILLLAALIILYLVKR